MSNLFAELQSIEDSTGIVHNIDSFECPICLEKVEETGKGIILRECLHTFCIDCIAAHIKMSNDCQIKCPFMDSAYSCSSFLQEREVKHLVTQEIYDKYLNQSLLQAEQKIRNTFHCRTVGCIGWCILEDTVSQFTCPSCSKMNCISCEAIHEGKTCSEYALSNTSYSVTESNKLSKETVDKMIENGSAMLCPACKAVIEKISGCDGLQCTLCKTHLCWATRGLRWGPTGQGDMSGGCHCNENSKKCHPECKNCH